MKLAAALWSMFFSTLAAMSAASARPPQTLAITLHGTGAQATRLPAYDPEQPLTITVNALALNPDAVNVAVSGPAGESLTVGLQRMAAGRFSGSLRLADQGDWRLVVTTKTRGLSTDTAPIALSVASPPASDAWEIGLAVGGGLFVVVGGAGFLLLRRAVAVRPAYEQAEAA